MTWTREKADAMLPVLQAFAEGKRIECKTFGAGWIPLSSPRFERDPQDYRVAPEPCGGIVAGERLQQGDFVKVENGVAYKISCSRWEDEDSLFVPECLGTGQPAVVVPRDPDELRPTLQPAPLPQCETRPTGEFVAGEDLAEGCWADVKDGVVVRQGLDGLRECHLYVESAVTKGGRVKILPHPVGRGWRDRVIPVAEPEFHHYEPRTDGEMDLEWMREKGQEFADDTSLIPMVRDLGHWLVLVIDALAAVTEGFDDEEEDEPVSDGNWEASVPAANCIQSGCKAYQNRYRKYWLPTTCYGPNFGYIYYVAVCDIVDGDQVEVNETTKQIRKAVTKPEVADANQDGFDEVNRPKHYVTDKSGYECIQFAELLDDGRLFSAFKYAWRVGQKEESPRDLEKMHWYLKRYLTFDDAEENSPEDLCIDKVIYGRPYAIGEAMRLIWKTTETQYWHEDKALIEEATRVIEAEIERRKEDAQ